MSRTETAELQTQRLKLNSSAAWVELYEIRYSATNCYRITSNTAPITFGGYVYSPFPMARAELERSNEGDVIDVIVECANVEMLQSTVRLTDLKGAVVNLTCVNTGDLTSGYTDRFVLRNIVKGSGIMCSIVLGQVNAFDVDFPGNRFNRSRCRWLPQYGGTECGYDTTRSGALSTCDGTLNGANGCAAHGTDEVNAGKARLHPLRFGGHPSLAKGPYA